ncbi:MAG: DegT/DnrJ/EryC1/StrS family aminotransferase [Lentisphaerae bacterium]|nr:DegT/DnrJ/EryC1/StrS family aminotransferase [Lentisphaerota bacterium]
MILQADPGRSFKAMEQKIKAAVAKVLESGWYILGKENENFENDFAAYNQVQYCLGTANGTDAIELILRALDIGSNDLVATVGNTATATVSAIERTGAQVRFADIEPGKFTMSAISLEKLLMRQPEIKAVVVVHLFGAAADMDALHEVAQRHHVHLIEDCAQAHGAEYKGRKCGTFGIAGSFSFYPTKNLGAFGDGGAVITNDSVLYEKMAALRQYGWKKRYISEFNGINSRLDEIQAAILSVKLPYLDANNEKRRQIAACYKAGLQDIEEIILPVEPENTRHVYHQFVIRVPGEKRTELIEYMKENGIGCAIHYPVAIPLQPGYEKIPHICDLSETLKVNDEILSLPMYPELTGAEVETIISALRGFFK